VADDLAPAAAELAEPVPQAATPPVAEPPAPKAEGRFRGRFLFVYLALGVVLGAAVAGFAFLVTDDEEQAARWSAWEPAGSADERLDQIADYVSGRYKLPSGNELLGITAAPLRVQDTPVAAVAIRRPAGILDAEDPLEIFDAAGTVAFLMCGLGESCAIAEGEPSPERQRLVRREALELALYTFRYVDDAANVVAFFPPPKGEEPTTAALLRRADLQAQLDRPLVQTLSPQVPLVNAIRPSEIVMIDELTGDQVFRFSFQQLQDGTAALVLDDLRLPPPEEETTTGTEEPAAPAPPATTTP
jgi:hypothetical protein